MGAPHDFVRGVFTALWEGYRERVSYARVYQELVARHGGTFENDHVAFRTLAVQKPWLGVAAVARPFEVLGWRAAGTYDFPDKKLSSVHYAPPAPGLPKVFVSELRVWELTPAGRRAALASAAGARAALTDADLLDLARADALPPARAKALAARLVAHLGRPWPAPAKTDVETLERESQFGAWTLLHGHSVNHFTCAVHAHGVPALDDIEKTVAALKAAGVPMKPAIEGARGSRLRQSSTQAVTLPTAMRVGRKEVRAPWTYAYFELAERPLLDGRRFEGFLGGQATQLFEMTRRRG